MKRQLAAAIDETEVQFVRRSEQDEHQAVHLLVVLPVVAIDAVVVVHRRFLVFDAHPEPRRIEDQRMTS